MIETALVTILMKGGMSLGAAQRFERHVDDLQMCRGGSDGLACVLLAWRCTEVAKLMQRCADAEDYADLLIGQKGACAARTQPVEA